MGLARELREERVPAVDQGDLAWLGKTSCLVQRQHQLGQCTGGLDAGRPTPDHDDVEQTRLRRGLVGHGGLEQVLQMEAKAFGVRYRVQREGMLGRPRHVEEVGPRTCGHHEMRPLHRRAVVEREAARGQVGLEDVCVDDADRGMLAEDGLMRPGDVLCGQLRAGDLVEQRLELVIVVAIDQRDLDAFIAQSARARHPGEATAEDKHSLSHHPSPVERVRPET